MLGMSLSAFTVLHVAISLVALVVGLLMLAAMMQNRHPPVLIALFLATTILTSVTGFMFPATGAISPAQIFGVISLVALALAVVSIYAFGAAGGWRVAFLVSAIFALYLNAFVAVVQAFQKLPALNALAPTQTEPPFMVAQLVLLVGFIAAGLVAVRKFSPLPVTAARA